MAYAGAPHPKAKVMVMEDDPDIRNSITTALSD